MRAPIRARLLETTNTAVARLRGQEGDLYCQVGIRCMFDDSLTSVVEGIVWFGRRLEVHTRNSRYLFQLEDR